MHVEPAYITKCLKNGAGNFLTVGSMAEQLTVKLGGLNRSMQHWLAVYSPEFQSPRFFADVD